MTEEPDQMIPPDKSMDAHRTGKAVRLWKWYKRYPVRFGIGSAIVVSLIAIVIFSQSLMYARYRSRVNEASSAKVKGDASYQQLEDAYIQLENLPQNRLKQKTPEELALDQKIGQLSEDLKKQYNLATGLYNSISGWYQDSEEVLAGYRGIMINRINIALLRKDYQEVLCWVQILEEWAGHSVNSKIAAELEAIREFISGEGIVSITGDDAIGQVEMYRLYDNDGRIVIGDPIMKSELPREFGEVDASAYVLVAKIEGIGRVNYPFVLEHGEDKEIHLEAPPYVPEGMVFIPGGKFFMGGPQSRIYREHLYNVDSFFMKQSEVTFAEYIEFWKSLTDESQKSDYMSRIRFDENDQRFYEAWDAAGQLLNDKLSLDYPVVGISHAAATAFCKWKGKEVGAVVRLPTDAEWEKAARGTDGRIYVWGNGYNPEHNLSLTKDNLKGKAEYPLFAPVGSFPIDMSIYGAVDMAGNVREYTSSDTVFQIKGGSASAPPEFLPACYSSDTPVVPSDVGFRYVQELDEIRD